MKQVINRDTVYTVPIGPIHPALKEPIRFTFTIDGERVVDVDIKPGWNHRGIEFLGRNRNLLQDLYLAERVCGICSVSHAIAFSLAVEEAAGITPPPRADYIRAIVAELERIHSHILWVGVAAHELGFDTLLHISWQIREKVMDMLEAITGNRVMYAMPTIGGVRRDITDDLARQIEDGLSYYREVYEKLVDLFLRDGTIKMRCVNVGLLSEDEAEKLFAVGPTARASGLKKDVRYTSPYIAYRDIKVEPVLPSDFGEEIRGDVYDRIVVRILEVKQSVEIIAQCLERMPDGDIMFEKNPTKLLAKLKAAEGEGIGRVEAPRGEVFHYVRLVAKSDPPVTWKVKTPTYSNLMSWVPMFREAQIADIPPIIASTDPCIACTDRVVILDEDGRQIMDAKELHRLSVEKTRRLMGE